MTKGAFMMLAILLIGFVLYIAIRLVLIAIIVYADILKRKGLRR